MFPSQLPLLCSLHSYHSCVPCTATTPVFPVQLPLLRSLHSYHSCVPCTATTPVFPSQLPLLCSLHSYHSCVPCTATTPAFPSQLPLLCSLHSCHCPPSPLPFLSAVSMWWVRTASGMGHRASRRAGLLIWLLTIATGTCGELPNVCMCAFYASILSSRVHNRLLLLCTVHTRYISYSGFLSQEKTFANCLKIDFRGENFRESPQKREIVFSHERNRLYST